VHWRGGRSTLELCPLSGALLPSDWLSFAELLGQHAQSRLHYTTPPPTRHSSSMRLSLLSHGAAQQFSIPRAPTAAVHARLPNPRAPRDRSRPVRLHGLVPPDSIAPLTLDHPRPFLIAQPAVPLRRTPQSPKYESRWEEHSA
jgi:hypothetical protein